MTRLLGTAVLLGVSLLVAFTGAEVLSRLVMPIKPVPFSDARGHETDVREDALRLKRSGVFRQVTREFDATYSTTPLGHRIPEVAGNPDEVFIGDSFTFGLGVDDADTFVARYCSRRGEACANLGRIGTGTAQQVDILRAFLEQEGWRPRRVRLMMFAMTGALMNGNDLTDNLAAARSLERVDTDDFVSAEANPVLRLAVRLRYAFQRLNLTRIVLLYVGPQLRQWLTPQADRALVAEALRLTGVQLARLDGLCHGYGVTCDVVIIHPMQDVLRGTDGETLAGIRSITPAAIPVHSTANAVRAGTADFYYAADMHLNARGHRAVSEYLLSLG